MEAKSRSQGLLLAGLFVVLALALWWNYGGGREQARDRRAATGCGPPHRPPGVARRPGCRRRDWSHWTGWRSQRLNPRPPVATRSGSKRSAASPRRKGTSEPVDRRAGR